MVFILLSVLWIGSVIATPLQHVEQYEPVPTEPYLLHEVLDHLGYYHVFWKFNSTTITFEIHVNTTGYVGFGFSPNGKMYPSDVVIGWMKDGVPHFADRHTVGHSQPVLDDVQDYQLLHMEENENGTMMKFVRPLTTCDDQDLDIVDDTMRIIYSYHPDDPADDATLQWHGGTRRGAKSMLLLSTSEQISIPADAKTKDFIHKKFHVPTKRTTYQCRVHSFEEVKTKHHMIKFEAVIESGHEPYVHHMNVYKCKNYPRKYIGSTFECYTGDDLSRYPCGNVVAGWAVGSGPFHFPENVGLPVGENEHDYAYIIEIHYNNPGGVTGLIDSSGIRFTYTSVLRQHDAGILTIGGYENRMQIIPPHYKNFTARVECAESIITKAMTDTSLEEVKLFGLWQHAHLLGRAITTRHYRGETELEPIAIDNHYDFDFQETRMLKNEVSLRKGDSIQVDCVYDSTGRQNMTFGGFSTSDEMCFSFIYYYPRLPLYMTLQATVYDTIPGNDKLQTTFVDWINHETFVDEFISKMSVYDWTDETVREQFQTDVLNSTVKSLTYTQDSLYATVRTYRLKEPTYVEQTKNCTIY